jgi:hypothetical protein
MIRDDAPIGALRSNSNMASPKLSEALIATGPIPALETA